MITINVPGEYHITGKDLRLNSEPIEPGRYELKKGDVIEEGITLDKSWGNELTSIL